jgi:aspartyl/asparaginyl beta-hydroxylase (cupin superfamily)
MLLDAILISLLLIMFTMHFYRFVYADYVWFRNDVKNGWEYFQSPVRWPLGFLNTSIRKSVACPPILNLDKLFPEHVEFKAAFEDIKKEALYVLENFRIPSFDQVDANFSRIADYRWKTYILKWYGDLHTNCTHCPVTAALLQKHNKIIWSAMFSILEPGTMIPNHQGPSAAAMRYHLCLQVPKQGTAKIRVHREWITYEEGGEYLFYDIYDHEVRIEAPAHDDLRIVLFMDVARTDLKQPLKGIINFIANNAKFAGAIRDLNARGEVQKKI